MAKDPEDRFDDTVKYVRTSVQPDLAQHLELTATTQSTKEIIGDDLSLGGIRLWKDEEKTQQRRALRALLLCQRLYFSSLWAKMYFKDEVAGKTSKMPPVPDGQEPAFANQVPPVNADRWPQSSPSWKATKEASVKLWKDQSEAAIQDAIKTFAITSQQAGSLLAAAQDSGEATAPLVACNLVRTGSPFPSSTICYAAVMFWLFRSGLVSYRWMLKYDGAPPSKLREVFGRGQIVWSSDMEFKKTDAFPAVGPGKIVHLYVNNEYRFAGHWLVSDGNGKAYGRNNDDSNGEDRKYDLCVLKNQFLAYKEKYEGSDQLTEGIAEVFDPVTLPSRI